MAAEYDAAVDDAIDRVDHFEPLVATEATRRVAATDLEPATGEFSDLEPQTPNPEPRTSLEGTLVHRALQRGTAPSARFLRPHERALVEDVEGLLDRAVSAFEAIAADPGMAAARMLREVPFSLRRSDGSIVRGAIDAIIEHADGRIEVIEFKTGQRRQEHEDQLGIYLEAARVLFPKSTISGRFIYAREGQLSDSSGV